MLIVDADVHLMPPSEGSYGIDADELLRRMDKAGVEKAVTWLHPPYRREIDQSLRYIYEATKRFPDRVLGFGWADPNLGVAKAKDTVRKCIYEYGFYGIKLNGAQNSYFIDDPNLSLPIVEEVAKTGKILALHVGADAYEYTHPFRVGKIAWRFPELPILMVHMGGVAFADLTEAAIEVALAHPNLILVGSAVRSIPILKAIKILGASRVCFGSDTPFELMHVEVAKYRALLDGELPPEEKALVMGGNIVRLFGLKMGEAEARGEGARGSCA
ncbi:MAG: amidohydrolase family protein [Bacillota bacterium]